MKKIYQQPMTATFVLSTDTTLMTGSLTKPTDSGGELQTTETQATGPALSRRPHSVWDDEEEEENEE